ncbi:hypothetical protein H4Q26_011526 [Puccinia striiformis f. sp. tritici PST-130]|nr:hypothetical protein H4Q26_011526 [Puccinia striiformis f. sp. tritici PST-130]
MATSSIAGIDRSLKRTHAFSDRINRRLPRCRTKDESGTKVYDEYRDCKALPSAVLDQQAGVSAGASDSTQLVQTEQHAAHQPSTLLSKSLIRRKEARSVKPDFHPQWKLHRVISGHLGWVRSAAVEPGNQWFVTGAGDRIIKVWDLASGNLKLSLTGHISTVRVFIRHLMYSLLPVVTLRESWDMRTKAQVHVLSGHTATIADVKCQESDPQVITGSMDSTIRLWDLAAGRTMAQLTHHHKSVRSLTIHPTEYSFASGSSGGNNIKKWKCPEGMFVHNFSGHDAIINTVCVNEEGVMYSVVTDNGSMTWWDYKTGLPFQTMSDIPQPGSLDAEAGVFCSTFDATGTRLITGCADKTIKIYREHNYRICCSLLLRLRFLHFRSTTSISTTSSDHQKIHLSKQQDAFLKHLNKFIIQKESEIEAVSRGHYQDFLGSVDKLLSVRQGTISLKSHVVSLDGSLQSRVTKVLFGSKSLEELQFVHLKPLLSFAEFAEYLGEALPNEKIRIREELGSKALESIALRDRRWKSKKDRLNFNNNDTASLALLVRLNTPVEIAVSERHDYHVLDSVEGSLIDFGPLYLAIHIHETLDAREELQKSFRDDRRAQAHLILASMTPTFSLDSLNSLIEQIVGFFIIENQILKTTKAFRDENDVDSLWIDLSDNVIRIVRSGLTNSNDLDLLLNVKTKLLLFSQTLESYEYNVTQFHELLSTLSIDYIKLLNEKFSIEFEQFIKEDDHQPMMINNEDEFDKVIEVSFLPNQGNWTKEELSKQAFPTALPFTQAYPLCCIHVRNYVTKHHAYCDSITRDADDSIRKSLDSLLINHVGIHMFNQINQTKNLSQLTQIVINTLFFLTACDELEIILISLRVSPRFISPELEAKSTFKKLLKMGEQKIIKEIAIKIQDFFELSEYDWKRKTSIEVNNGVVNEEEISDYLKECLSFIDTLIDNVLVLTPIDFNENIFFGAWRFIGQLLKRTFSYLRWGLSILSNDIHFASLRLKNSSFSNSSSTSSDISIEVHQIFKELVQTVNLLSSPDVGKYLDLDYRDMKWDLVRSETLPLMLVKLLTCMNSVGSNVDPGRKASVQEVLKTLSP